MTKTVADLIPKKPAKPAAAKTTLLRFKKKPDTVLAIQFTKAMAIGEQDLPEGVDFRSRSMGPNEELRSHKHVVMIRDGVKRVEVGDWIVAGKDGYEVMSDEEFQRMYELV